MGEVIEFGPVRGALRRGGKEPGSVAQILFFTGVRYERAADPTTPASAPGKRKTPERGGLGGGKRRRRG